MQFSVDPFRQSIQGCVITIAPGSQQVRDFRGVVHGATRPPDGTQIITTVAVFAGRFRLYLTKVEAHGGTAGRIPEWRVNMRHCTGLAWVLTAVVALPLAGCAGPEGAGVPTAPSALSVPNGGPTALLENAPFNGHDSGTFEFLQAGCATGLSPLRTHTTGTGTLIGAYSFETQECFDTNALTFSGSFTITAANGDTLVGAYAGNVTGFLDDVTADVRVHRHD